MSFPKTYIGQLYELSQSVSIVHWTVLVGPCTFVRAFPISKHHTLDSLVQNLSDDTDCTRQKYQFSEKSNWRYPDKEGVSGNCIGL